MIFPSANAFGIPDLDPDQQADSLVPPLRAWGSVGRTTRTEGTWHFYVDDQRFSKLLTTPNDLIATGCSAAVEPNISVYDDTPMALVLHSLYRKRFAARIWQTSGIMVWVDLNLPLRVLDSPYWSLGVPVGWRAYATRGYDKRITSLYDEYDTACQHAGGTPVFLVIGGGRGTADWCSGRPGVIHSGYSRTREVYSSV